MTTFPSWFPALSTRFVMHCRVCGFASESAPWGADGWTLPSFCICRCCGSTAGVEDESTYSVAAFRQSWLRNGAPWFEARRAPKDWDLDDQLASIPPPFRPSPKVRSVQEVLEIADEFGFETAARVRFEGGLLMASELLQESNELGHLLAYQPTLNDRLFHQLVALDAEEVIEVLRTRPELSWNEDWRRLVHVESHWH